MCEHSGELRIEQCGVEQEFGVHAVAAYCPDCGAVMWSGRRYEDEQETKFTFVSPAWHDKWVVKTAEKIQELMAIIADNASKRAALENEYQEMNNQLIRAREAAEQTAINRLNLITSMRVRLVEIAVILSRAGDYDHKSKNAQILRAVASMLGMSQWRASGEQPPARDMDDIPF